MKALPLFAAVMMLSLAAGFVRADEIPLGPGSDRIAEAKEGDGRLLVTDGFRPSLEKVRRDIEKSIGHPLKIEYSESHVLQRVMESGQAFELALVTADVVAAETAKGTILPGSPTVARIRIGLFQRGDAPLVDVSTRDALKKALLGAKSVVWSAGSAADPTAQNVIAKLNISQALKDHVQTTVMGHPAQPVALGPGEYELRFNAIGPVAGPLPLAGEVPPPLEVPAVIPAGIGSHGDRDVARAIVKYLMQPAFTSVLNDNKMMR